MSEFDYPVEFKNLPSDKQEIIRDLLVKYGLLTETGEVAKTTTKENLPARQKEAIEALLKENGVNEADLQTLEINFKCIAARAAEVAAVAACALVPGGQLAIAACIALAHAAADEACN